MLLLRLDANLPSGKDRNRKGKGGGRRGERKREFENLDLSCYTRADLSDPIEITLLEKESNNKQDYNYGSKITYIEQQKENAKNRRRE
jgi:hypothetical protein